MYNGVKAHDYVRPRRETEMKCIRLFTGSNGESHFEDIDIPFGRKDAIDARSEIFAATGVQFRETPADYDLDFHCVPDRQFVITLEGQVDITVGDGTTRRIGVGDVLLVEDTTGRGHISRAVNKKPHKHLFIILDKNKVS
jgi:hypothetical protein